MASAFKNSPKWMKRVELLFAQSDLDKNNLLSIEDFELWMDNLKKEVVDADPTLLEKLREATHAFWVDACGLKPGVQLTKDQFIDRASEFAAAESANQDKRPVFFKMLDAYFDLADTNRDGFLSMDEYEKVLKASYFDADAAKMAFGIIDVNHDGKISREELKTYTANFWFDRDDKASAGMYGPKYE